MGKVFRLGFLAFTVLVGMSSVPQSAFAFTYRVTQFNDPDNLLTPAEHSGILTNLAAAVGQWSEHLYSAGTPCVPVNIDIEIVAQTESGRVAASPTESIYLKSADGVDIFESCASFKLRTGENGRGCEQSDITILIESSYLRNYDFIDPNPDGPHAPIPDGKVDLVMVLAHELGHGFGIDGWRDMGNGVAPSGASGKTITVFDSLVSFANPKAPVFTGKAVTALYGRPMPLYFFQTKHNKEITIKKDGEPYSVWQSPSQNIYHYGRFTSATSDTNLTFFGLMAGAWVFKSEPRRPVGALDYAILKDLGLPIY